MLKLQRCFQGLCIIFLFLFIGLVSPKLTFAQTVNTADFIAGPDFIPHYLSTGEYVRFSGEGGPGPGTPVRQYKNANYEQFFIQGGAILRREDTSWAPLPGWGNATCSDGGKAIYTLAPGCKEYSNGEEVSGDGVQWLPASITVGQTYAQQTHQIVTIKDTTYSSAKRTYCTVSNVSGYGGTSSCGQAPTLQFVRYWPANTLTFCTGITNERPVIQLSGVAGAGSEDGFYYMQGWGLVGFKDASNEVGLMPADGQLPEGATCGSSFTPAQPEDVIPHSCKSFCRGNPYDPCSATKERDCSFPFSEEEFLAPTATLSPEKISEITLYLLEYLYSGLAQSVNGFFARVRAEQLLPELCEDPSNSNDPYLAQKCQEASGESSVTITLDPQVSSAITMPKDASTADMQFENSSTYLYRQDGTEALEFGVIPKTQTRNDYWYRFGMLHKFKESCFQSPGGRVIGFNDHPLFGKIRCMNFQEFYCSPHCPQGLNNERIVFQGPLKMCIEVSGTEDPIEQARRVVSCEKALNNQSVIPPAIRSELNNVAVFPVARFPIIIATENLAPNQDPQFGGGGLTIFQRLIGQITHNVLNLEGEEGKEFFTKYQLYVIPTAQDTAIASKVARDSFFPPDHQKSHEPDNEFTFSFLGIDINLGDLGGLGVVLNYFNNTVEQDSNRPFWRVKAPDEFRMADGSIDSRFNLIHVFLNSGRNYDRCVETINHIDNVVTTATVNIVGAQGNVLTMVLNTAAAQLTTLLRGTENETDFQNQIQCAIFPAWLETVDKYAQQTARVLFPGGEEEGESHKEAFIDYQNQKRTVIQDVSNQVSGDVLIEKNDCREEPITANTPYETHPHLYTSPGVPKLPCCRIEEGGQCIEDRNVGLRTGYDVVNEGSGGSGNTIPLKGQGGIPLFSMLFNNGVFATKPADHQPNQDCKEYEAFLHWMRGEPGPCGNRESGNNGNTGSNPTNPGACTNIPDENIPFRDTSINPKPVNELIQYIRDNNGRLGGFSSAGLATMERNIRDKYDEVVSRSRAAGYNPAYVMAIWIEETGAGAYNASRQFGCGSSGFDGELNCFLKLFENYSAGSSQDSLFKDCRQGDQPTYKEFSLFYSEGICPTIQRKNYSFCTNKAFPGRIDRFYKAVAQ